MYAPTPTVGSAPPFFRSGFGFAMHQHQYQHQFQPEQGKGNLTPGFKTRPAVEKKGSKFREEIIVL